MFARIVAVAFVTGRSGRGTTGKTATTWANFPQTPNFDTGQLIR